MKKTIFLALAMVIFGGCGKADSAECPDIRTQENSHGNAELYIRARDDISIHNIIINRGNCLYTPRAFSGFLRNGVDKILRYEKPLTSDYIESIKEEYREEAYKELNAGPKKLGENIDLKFGEERRSIWLRCKPLEVVLETNLGQCEYKFD